jgi:hypothetical protein
MHAPRIQASALVGVLTLAVASCVPGNAPRTDPNQPAPLSYALPKTVLVIDVSVERVTASPGRYCDVLDLFFPDQTAVVPCQVGDDNPTRPAPGHQMIQAKQRTQVAGYAVTQRGVPDETRRHAVDLTSSWHVDRSDALALTEGGALSGAEMQRTDRTLEIVFDVLSKSAGLLGRLIYGTGTPAEPASPLKAASPPGLLSEVAAPPWVRTPELALNFALLPKTRQEQYAKYWATDDGKTRLVLAARSYAGLIADLKSLGTMIRGEGGTEAPVLALITDIEKRLDGHLADDFLGTSTKDTWTPTYEITPGLPPIGDAWPTQLERSLFTFSGCGVVEEKTAPVKNGLAALKCADSTGATISSVSLVVKTASGLQPGRAHEAVPLPQPVLWVVRPEPVSLELTGGCKASVTVSVAAPGDKASAANVAPTPCTFPAQASQIAQWGVEVGLPKAGRDWAYAVTLYEATGAVKSLKLTSKALLDKSMADAAFGAVTTLLDAKDAAKDKAKKDADAAAAVSDELTVLTKARQVLEERAKIKKLCDELGIANCKW